MSVSYSTIKAVSEPEAMASLLTEQVFGPVIPSVQVRKVRTKQGRRFEAPRVIWNVYEAELELPGGVEARPLFWTTETARTIEIESVVCWRHRTATHLTPVDTRDISRT